MTDPLALGRSVVVAPGQAAPVPWSACPRVRVAAVDAAVADELGAAWRERRAVVVELVPGLGLDDPAAPPHEAVTGLQPWEWTVSLDLAGERLHHAVWANAVDARDPGRLRWRWADAAVALGAEAAGGGADVVLPGGTAAVCDGGPLDAGLPERLGVAVVHRVALEHGGLRPLGANDPAGVPLAPDQLAAVAEPRGSARVIAPAGSGKTRVLTERARLLVRGWGLPPAAMALVAFNVRAASEMQARLVDVPGVRVRTLNSLGLRLCGSRTTIEEPEVRRLLAGLVAFPKRAETDPAAPWIEALGRVRLGLADPAAVEGELPDVADLERVARAYRSRLAADGTVDFDEQVAAAIERLLADPAFRARSQRFARVLLVDEFQDLTPAHLLLVRLLAGPAGVVFGVGDDDQTIYGYAGATPRWLVDFARWFPGSAAHALEVNYRCPPAVVTAAANLLTRNALRVPKRIRPAGSGDRGNGALIVVDGEDGPSVRTAARVRELLAAGAAPSDVAVLARVNAALAPVQVLLRHAGVPVDGGVDRRFLQRGGVRAALAWLAVAAAPAGSLPGPVLREAARRPKRGMSQSLLDLVAKQRSVPGMASLAGWLDGKGSAREAGKIRDLAEDVRLVRDAAAAGTTAGILSVVRSRVGDGGLDASAGALDAWSHGAIAAHGDDLDALVELAALEPDPARFPSWLAGLLERPAEAGGVTLASIHAVKGREWPHVVVHHATAGLLPHRLAADAEEERRVFHVALTRCRSSASIVPGTPPSPFLAELAAPGEPRPAVARPPAVPAPGPASARAPAARAATAPADHVPAVPGLRFTHLGHEHEVVEVSGLAVRTLVGGGPATSAVALGTLVTVAGRTRILTHPRQPEAWERLRAWRAERSRAMGKPAFVVLDDKTLRLVAAVLPTTEAGLLAIPGIGPVKLESYGDDLIAIAEEVLGDRRGPFAGPGSGAGTRASNQGGAMPKVDPQTGEPMSDAPEQEDPELRGGKSLGDPDLADATSTGGSPGIMGKKAQDPNSYEGKLPGEKEAKQ
jgi:DNA helicase-2/ATP-dependent DNA helicase PcrA